MYIYLTKGFVYGRSYSVITVIAAKKKFKKLVVQGGLTTGLLHALVAMDMPGPGITVARGISSEVIVARNL